MKKYTIQNNPFVVPTNDGKVIKEHFGIPTTGDSKISIAHMIAPPGWSEPFQKPEFDEYTFIIKGKKQFIIDGDTVTLEAGQSIKIKKTLGFNIPIRLPSLVNTLLFVHLLFQWRKCIEKTN
jgi:mannose-6-phosphate isomerase-like protein (cupin superfamily)